MSWNEIYTQKEYFFESPQEYVPKVIELIKCASGKRVLDLGCGDGRHTVLLTKAGFEVHATDISPKGIELTRRTLRESNLEANVVLSDCYRRFPFVDGFFDAVIATQTIHHNLVRLVRYCISEMERVLRTEGIIYITVAAGVGNAYGATDVRWIDKRTFIPLNGNEKGIVHFIYDRELLAKDLRDFTELDSHRDKEGHLCFLGKLKP